MIDLMAPEPVIPSGEWTFVVRVTVPRVGERYIQCLDARGTVLWTEDKESAVHFPTRANAWAWVDQYNKSGPGLPAEVTVEVDFRVSRADSEKSS